MEKQLKKAEKAARQAAESLSQARHQAAQRLEEQILTELRAAAARGVKLAGSGFWMYTGMGARLEWALLNYFIDCHVADGYEFILPPHMLEYQCGLTAGQFPKFADEVYKMSLITACQS